MMRLGESHIVALKWFPSSHYHLSSFMSICVCWQEKDTKLGHKPEMWASPKDGGMEIKVRLTSQELKKNTLYLKRKGKK